METNVDYLKRDNKFKKLCKSKRNIESKLNYRLWSNPKRHFINNDNDFFFWNFAFIGPRQQTYIPSNSGFRSEKLQD